MIFGKRKRAKRKRNVRCNDIMGCLSSSVVSPSDEGREGDVNSSPLLFYDGTSISRSCLCTDATIRNTYTNGDDFLSTLEQDHTEVKDVFISYGFLEELPDDTADRFFQSILDLPMLQTVSMLGEETTSLVASEGLSKALGKNSTLTKLKLHANYMDDNDQRISSMTSKESTLIRRQQQQPKLINCHQRKENIHNYNNRSKNEGRRGRLEALSEALCRNTTLTSLELSRNQIGCEGVQVLAGALCVNITLTNLDLSCNQIGTRGLQALAKVLHVNATLTALDLMGNQVGEVGCKTLSYGLRANESLTYLNLGYNKIRKEGCQSLVHALCFNESLNSLDLRGNQIGNEGCGMVAQALFQNTTLANLNLSYNQIGNEGCIALADALEMNSSLCQLDLSYNEIQDKGSAALSNTLRSNVNLTSLDLGKNKIEAEGWQAWVSMLVADDSNMTLECVTCNMEKDIKCHLHPLRYFHLKRSLTLNMAGRYSLLKCSRHFVREEWVEALIRVKDDFICIFYFLSQKPELCIL